MKKWVIALVVVVAIVAAYFLLRGFCASDKELAQQYLIQGDRAYSVAEVTGAKLRKQLETSSKSPGELVSAAPSLKEDVSRYKTMLTLSLLSYQNTNALYNIQDYFTFKNMMVRAIALDLDAADMLAPILGPIPKASTAPLAPDSENIDQILKKMASARKLYRTAREFSDTNHLMTQ